MAWGLTAPPGAGCEWEGCCHPQRTARDTQGLWGRSNRWRWGAVLCLGSRVQARPSWATLGKWGSHRLLPLHQHLHLFFWEVLGQ